MSSKSLSEPALEERLRNWIGTCPGFYQNRDRNRLIQDMMTTAKLPLDWYGFEAALKRAGYEIGRAQDWYICSLPKIGHRGANP